MTNATIVIYIHKKKGPERNKKFSTVNMTRPVKWVNKTNTIHVPATEVCSHQR